METGKMTPLTEDHFKQECQYYKSKQPFNLKSKIDYQALDGGIILWIPVSCKQLLS